MINSKWIILFVLTSIFCGFFGYWLGSSYGFMKETSSQNIELDNKNLKIGEKTSIHHIEVTYNSVRTLPDEKDENQQYVFVDVTIRNNREQAYELTLHKFALVDSAHYTYGYELTEQAKGILGGQIGTGRTARGELAFLVPIDKQYELIFTDHLRTGQAIWTVVP